MSNSIDQQFVEQLNAVILVADGILRRSRHNDFSDLRDGDVRIGMSRIRAAVERVSGLQSSYPRDLNSADEISPRLGVCLAMYRGSAQALLDDVRAGYTKGLQELVHGDIFSDYFEMAEHLLGADYKDAAAVIAGSTLEGHLRNLCRQHGVDVERQNPQGNTAKKADSLNACFRTGTLPGEGHRGIETARQPCRAWRC